MKQSLMKLVSVILEKIDERPEHTPSENGIRTWLSGQGFGKREIDAAMKLIQPSLLTQAHTLDAPATSLRSFSAFEQFKLSTQARDALVRLDMYRLLTPYEREMIMDRLSYFEGEVGLEEIDYILASVITERDVESQHTIYDVLEDRGDVLH